MSSAVFPLPNASRRVVTDSVARDDWVEAQLTRSFMRNAQPAHYAAFIMIVVMVAMLYRHVEPTGLWLWAVAVVAVTLMRNTSRCTTGHDRPESSVTIARIRNISAGSA